MTAAADKTAKKQEASRGKPFAPGKSGNPRGRPRGRSKVAQLADELFQANSQAIAERVIKEALRGKGWALKLAVDRVCPPMREPKVSIKVPTIESIEDATHAILVLFEAAARGELEIGQAERLAKMPLAFIEAKNQGDLERRLSQLEKISAKVLGGSRL